MIIENICMISLDIETTGTRPGCGILSIGATTFSPFSDHESSAFEMYIDQNLRHSSLTDNPDTMGWWDRQNQLVRRKNFSGTNSQFYTLHRFQEWVHNEWSKYSGGKLLWVKGPHFDISILERAFDLVNVQIPWSYNEIMDLRTLQTVHHRITLPKRTSVAHIALEDAIYQAQCVATILRGIY